jgi:Domain of unknown function (DUF397)
VATDAQQDRQQGARGLARDGSWRRSSFCATAECIEVAMHADAVLVRDSQGGGDCILRCTAADWRAFISVIKAD